MSFKRINNEDNTMVNMHDTEWDPMLIELAVKESWEALIHPGWGKFVAIL